MGFFSEIASEARRGMTASARQAAAPPVAPKPAPSPPAAVPEAPAVQPAPAPVDLPAPAAPASAPVVPEAPPAPEPPAIDLTPEAGAADEAERRKAHEAAEAKRKAEWDAKQAARDAARQERLARIAAMSDEDVVAGAVTRIGTDTEKLTRRNMKEAVCEYVQDQCRRNPALARLALRPEKSMVHCFQYINRKAREYAEQEMKDNGIERRGTYGCDVPDGLVYQWAMDYLDDLDAKEDHGDEEKFVPKPYIPKSGGTKTKTAKKKPEKKPAEEKPKSTAGIPEQISLM